MQEAISKAAKVLPVEAETLMSLWEAYWNDGLGGIITSAGSLDPAYLKAQKLQDSKKDPQTRVPVEPRSHYDE